MARHENLTNTKHIPAHSCPAVGWYISQKKNRNTQHRYFNLFLFPNCPSLAGCSERPCPQQQHPCLRRQGTRVGREDRVGAHRHRSVPPFIALLNPDSYLTCKFLCLQTSLLNTRRPPLPMQSSGQKYSRDLLKFSQLKNPLLCAMMSNRRNYRKNGAN